MEPLKETLYFFLNKKNIFQSAFWLYFSEGVNKVLRFLIFLLIARYFGPEKFGLFEYLFSFVGLFFLFADFGVSSIFIREYQQREEKSKHINNALSSKLLFSFICSLLALAGYFFLKKDNLFFVYFFIVFYYFLLNIENFFESFFLAIYQTHKRFIFNTLSSLVLLFAIILGFFTQLTIFKIAIAYFLSILIGIITAYLFFLAEAKIKIQLDFSLLSYYLKNGLALVFFGLLGYIFFSTDKIILAHLRNLEEVGYYSLASRMINVLTLIPSLLISSIYPYLAHKAKEEDFRFKILNFFNFIIFALILAGLILAGISFFLAPLIPLFMGSNYTVSVSIFQSFVWILVFIFPTSFLDYLLLSYHKQWLDFVITLIPAILNIILNFVFIPYYGVYGAVLASILSQIVNFLFTYLATLYVLKKLKL